MDARDYLRQLRDVHSAIVRMQERVEEHAEALDMLRGALGDGMPRGSSDGKALENAVVEHAEMMDAYTGELLRWTALRSQALEVFERARAVLSDGAAHAIDPMWLDMCELHYLPPFMSYEGIRQRYRAGGMPIYGKTTVKWYCDRAVEWLGYSRGTDGRPLLPLVSE